MFGEPANVMLVTIDCLRPDHLGCYGHGAAQTPAMDRIAARGCRFQQAITSGGWTMAAFPGILTSTYASMYNGCRAPLDRRRPRLAAALRRAGYATFGITANPLLATLGYGEDFDRFYSVAFPPDGRWFRRRGLNRFALSLLQQQAVHQLLAGFGKEARPAREYLSANHLMPELAQVLATPEEPFFLWVHYMDAHWPYHLEQDLAKPAGRAMGWRDQVAAYRAMNRHIGERPSPQQHQRLVQLYQRAVSEVDRHIAQLLDMLDPRLDRTHVIITADHGEAFGEHGYYGHDRIGLSEELIRVPLLWMGPGLRQGGICDSPASLLDIAPSILDLVGLPVPAAMQGQSLASVLQGRGNTGRTITISESPWDWDRETVIAVRTPGYKLVYDNRSPDQVKLYDLVSDPGESSSLAGHGLPVEQELTEALRAHLEMVASSHAGAEAVPAESKELAERLRALGYIA